MNLVYLTTCFGTPSHTFIRREIREFQRRGIAITLYGIRKDNNIASDAADLVADTQYLYPLRLLSTLLANFYFIFFFPANYLKALSVASSTENGSLKKRLKLTYHFAVSARFAREFRKKNVSHIHAHFLHVPSSISMFASILSDIPFSVTVHSAGEKNLPHVDAIPLKLRTAQKLLMISRFNIDYYDAIEACAERSHVVRCGMHVDQFAQRAFASKLNKPLKVLAVGRFVEKKGFTHLINAAKILRDSSSNKYPDIEVEILGSGPLRGALIAQRDEAQLHDFVLLPGYASSDTVRKKMHEADVVVVPSVTGASGEMEGIPVVLMEAMASGVPVIASAHSGIPELVTAHTGTLVPEKDAQALALAIKTFIPDENKTRNARKMIEDQFNIGKVVDQRAHLFRERC